MTLRFDDSVGVFVRTLLTVLPFERVVNGWIVRDISGRLAFVSKEPLSDSEVSGATAAVEKALSAYCRAGSSILHIGMPGIKPLVGSSSPFLDTISLDATTSLAVRIIDHRIVGQDWLTTPQRGWQPPSPARLVFSSMKGGVGRSTALAVLATELAREGRKVLVIDLDLEAPGVGTMLIDEQSKPVFGVLDWYVERGIYGSIDSDFLVDMVASSKFGAGKGLIDVAPAAGRSSDLNPSNFLSKLARAYLELPQEDGPPISFLALTQRLVDGLAAQKSYDVVLIDARAGLNESTAAALLGLGADVLFFGVDTPQTFFSYGYLLAHLARLTQSEEDQLKDDWLYRLRMVHAKASPDSERQAAFRDRAYEMFSRYLYRSQPLLDENGAPLLDESSNEPLSTEQFGLDDREGPHYAWPILSDANFAEFDPMSLPSQLASEFYGRAYSGLFSGIRDLLDETGNPS